MTRIPDGRGRERRTDTILPSVLSAREHGCPPPPPDTLPPRRGGRPSSKTASAVGRPAAFARLADARRALSRSARAVAAVACLCLAGPLALPAQAQTTNFYLWRTTLTVGESSGYLGYHKSEGWGELSHGAKFNYPPWSPPSKHHFDPDYEHEILALYIDDTGSLILEVVGALDLVGTPGDVTLWIRNTALVAERSSTVTIGFGVIDTSEMPDLDWSEDDEVGVVLSYTRELPSAPQNVSVTAPPGEDGDAGGELGRAGRRWHLSDRVLPRRIPPPERRGQEKKAVLSRLSRPRKGMRRQPADQRAAHGPGNGRPIPGPRAGVERRRLQRVVGDEDGPRRREDAAVGSDGVVRGHADEARRRARVPLPRRVQREHRDQLPGAAPGCVHGDRGPGDAGPPGWTVGATCSG